MNAETKDGWSSGIGRMLNLGGKGVEVFREFFALDIVIEEEHMEFMLLRKEPLRNTSLPRNNLLQSLLVSLIDLNNSQVDK